MSKVKQIFWISYTTYINPKIIVIQGCINDSLLN
jgi:hypothetical protein